MNSYKLQTRYAQSLFDLALEKNISKQVYQDMLLVMDVCKQNRELRVVLKNPVIKPCKKKSIVNDVFSGRVEELTLAFVELLIAKRRDILLFEIALFDEVIDLVGRIRLRNIQKFRKLTYRRLMQGMDNLNGERLHCAQRALPFPNKLKDPAEKLKLELVINL